MADRLAAVHRANVAVLADAIERHDPAGAAAERADRTARALALAPLLTADACRALTLAELADLAYLLRRAARAGLIPSA